MQRVLGAILAGDVVRHPVTIPEGVTSAAATEILMRAAFLVGVAPVAPEGAILPETYEVQRGEDRSAVLQRMMNARDALLATLWRRRRADLPFETPDQAVVLASIVEKETALPDERPRIAAVFVNLIAGLPPTPIANPGRASLAAVLDPPRTSEMYFVADGTGGHVFSTSLEEHQKNVARWRAVEKARTAPAPS